MAMLVYQRVNHGSIPNFWMVNFPNLPQAGLSRQRATPGAGSRSLHQALKDLTNHKENNMGMDQYL